MTSEEEEGRRPLQLLSRGCTYCTCTLSDGGGGCRVTLDDQVTAGPGVVYSVTVLAATGAAAAPQSIHDDVTGDVADT